MTDTRYGSGADAAFSLPASSGGGNSRYATSAEEPPDPVDFGLEDGATARILDFVEDLGDAALYDGVDDGASVPDIEPEEIIRQLQDCQRKLKGAAAKKEREKAEINKAVAKRADQIRTDLRRLRETANPLVDLDIALERAREKMAIEQERFGQAIRAHAQRHDQYVNELQARFAQLKAWLDQYQEAWSQRPRTAPEATDDAFRLAVTRQTKPPQRRRRSTVPVTPPAPRRAPAGKANSPKAAPGSKERSGRPSLLVGAIALAMAGTMAAAFSSQAGTAFRHDPPVVEALTATIDKICGNPADTAARNVQTGKTIYRDNGPFNPACGDDEGLVKAVAVLDSGGNPSYQDPNEKDPAKRAVGIVPFSPKIFNAYAAALKIKNPDPKNPEHSLRVAVQIINQLEARVSDADRARYNAAPPAGDGPKTWQADAAHKNSQGKLDPTGTGRAAELYELMRVLRPDAGKDYWSLAVMYALHPEAYEAAHQLVLEDPRVKAGIAAAEQARQHPA